MDVAIVRKGLLLAALILMKVFSMVAITAKPLEDQEVTTWVFIPSIWFYSTFRSDQLLP